MNTTTAAELFSANWMALYQAKWNAEPALAEQLARSGFNSVIAYGFQNEENPRSVLVVKKGQVVKAGVYNGEELNWDLRASKDSWKTWLNEGIGTGGLAWAYTSRKLKFYTGDYLAMIKNPTTAGPFVKSFAVMGHIPTDW